MAEKVSSPLEIFLPGHSLQENGTTRLGSNREILLFFIPGNPGLIQYYSDFLLSLFRTLPECSSIFGTSLLGFGAPVASHSQSLSDSLQRQISPLEAQTQFLRSRLTRLVDTLSVNRGLSLIISGHSVGAWLALNLISLLFSGELKLRSNVKLIGAILLTPTIADIALSQSGRWLTPFLETPGSIALTGWAAWILGSVTPEFLRRRIIGIATSGRGETQKLHCGLLERNEAAWALELARDEMRKIKEVGWADNILGKWRGRLGVLYAETDPYVAVSTRSHFIAKHAPSSTGDNQWPRILIDDSGMKHAFSLEHSEVVVGIVSRWIVDMVSETQ